MGGGGGNTHIILAVGWKNKKRDIYFGVVREGRWKWDGLNMARGRSNRESPEPSTESRRMFYLDRDNPGETVGDARLDIVRPARDQLIQARFVTYEIPGTRAFLNESA